MDLMPEHVSAALVMVGGGVLTQIVAAILTWSQSRKNHEKLKAIETVQVETKHEMNSRLTELLASVKAQAHAAGILEGIEVEKRRAIDHP